MYINGLPAFLKDKYNELEDPIKNRLMEFSNVSEKDYFYELCFCVCTPQSRAKNALEIEKILRKRDFLNKNFDTSKILRDPKHYIRFHNQKAKRLNDVKVQFPEILKLLKSKRSAVHKRDWFVQNVNGFGMKESSHFLRNIGYRRLAILDRHILKHLVYCGLFDEIPNTATFKRYMEVENLYKNYARKIKIPVDELDLLFWSYETGEILK